jgi:hypothetical protein
MLEDRLSAMVAARMAMVSDSAFKEEINQLQWALRLIAFEEKK